MEKDSNNGKTYYFTSKTNDCRTRKKFSAAGHYAHYQLIVLGPGADCETFYDCIIFELKSLLAEHLLSSKKKQTYPSKLSQLLL